MTTDTEVMRPVSDRVPSWLLLVTGVVLTFLAANRWSIPLLGWVAPVPFLLYLRRQTTWRGRLLALVAMCAAMTLQTAKIITPPIHWMLAPMFGVPLAVGYWAMMVLWDGVRRRAGELVGLYAFPALIAVLDWALYTYGSLGSWGTAVNTRLDDLALLQLTSVFGIAGISFLMSWVAAAVALLLVCPRPARHVRHLIAVGVAVTLAYSFGSLRLYRGSDAPTVLVAGVVTDVGPTSEGLPDAAALAANQDLLFARSEIAARAGARLIAWNEVATVVEPGDEAALIARGTAFARTHEVDLVMAYAVLASHEPVLFDNKYLWIDEGGRILETYRKHHPVPGEPSIRGTEPLMVHDRPYARTAGAICYDYDFPAMAREHARKGAALVVVPSSDWAGIDPIHPKIARLRAIESGLSILRPVRWATSMAYDPYGRIRASLPVDEDNQRVLLAQLPTKRVPTLYAWWGDAPVALCGLFLVLVAVRVSRRRPFPVVG